MSWLLLRLILLIVWTDLSRTLCHCLSTV